MIKIKDEELKRILTLPEVAQRDFNKIDANSAAADLERKRKIVIVIAGLEAWINESKRKWKISKWDIS